MSTQFYNQTPGRRSPFGPDADLELVLARSAGTCRSACPGSA